jgi:hypothetical protein
LAEERSEGEDEDVEEEKVEVVGVRKERHGEREAVGMGARRAMPKRRAR